MLSLAELDRRHVWHPFTPFDTWTSPDYEMLAIASGRGCHLTDTQGRTYLDGNSSIWVNLHGHRAPAIDRALRAQLRRVAHTSFLGLTNDLAPLLARRLHLLAGRADPDALPRVFFSDDGSTAIEAAVKIIYQHFQLLGQTRRKTFVSLAGGYHGDTVGAMSVGQSQTFHGAYRGLLFPTAAAMAPHCYRCPHNRAAPERRDARLHRQCQWECIGNLRQTIQNLGDTFAGAVIEPLVQGAAGMIMHPEGYLSQASEIVHQHGGKLVLDEVMTAFHRAGPLLASHQENVVPDALALAKGLTGGYLPLAATLVQENLVAPFRGGPDRTFYHGHSYSGNQLGCAAALANLDLLEKPALAPRLHRRANEMRQLSQIFWSHPNVGDIRQTGLILAIELVAHWPDRRPFPPAARTGWRVSEAARRHGLLTRPVGDVLLLMPPLVVTARELQQMITALHAALHDILPPR